MEKYLFSCYLGKQPPNINAEKRFAEFKSEDKFIQHTYITNFVNNLRHIINGFLSLFNFHCLIRKKTPL